MRMFDNTGDIPIVDLWYIDVSDLFHSLSKQLYAMLNDKERSSIDFIKNEAVRCQKILCHYATRVILCNHLGLNSFEQVRFNSTVCGKPYVDIERSIEFNLSHSGDWALLAVCDSAVVGVDIEFMDSKRVCDLLDVPFLTEEERIAVMKLNGIAQKNAIFTIWTQKESLSKGLGAGLNLPFNHLASIWPCEHGSVTCCYDNQIGSLRDWFLLRIETPPSYVAYLAVSSGELLVRTQCFDWNDCA